MSYANNSIIKLFKRLFWVEKTKWDNRRIGPLEGEEKFFRWLKFKGIRMDRERLSKNDRERFHQRIHASLHMLRRKRTIRGSAYYGMPVCIIVALGVISYLNHYERMEPVTSVTEQKTEIVWQPLRSEDIRLVNGDSITSL